MRYVLDTSAVSLVMKGDANVIAHLKRVGRGEVCIPQPVVSEIAYGIQRLPKSKRRELLARRFDLVREEIVRAVWTDAVSEAFGGIKATLERKGERIEDFDAAVAAHAVAERCTLVTANLKHMTRIPGLDVEDWSGKVEA